MSTETITPSADTASIMDMPAAQALATDIAPPFDGWGYYKTPTRQPSGFWSAVRHRAANGELVVQLGRNRGAGPAIQWAGFSYRVPRETGLVTYEATFSPVSLTRSPNHRHAVSICAFMQINNGRPMLRELNGNVPVSLSVTGVGPFTLKVGTYVFLNVNGAYGESITRVSEVTERRYRHAVGDDGALTVSALAPVAEGDFASFDQLLEVTAAEARERDVGGLEEAVAAGRVSLDD